MGRGRRWCGIEPGVRSLWIGLGLMLGCGSSPATEADAAGDAQPGDASPTDAGDAMAPDADLAPEPPVGLQRWVVGDPADAMVTTSASGVILMGGGTDVDDAFTWAAGLAGGGDVVVLRASGSDGYNDYLYSDIGGFDSVETLLVDSRALADAPYVGWALAHAEVIFMAGGDQAVYTAAWGGTEVSSSLAGAWGRGAVVGGTSAGCAILGAFAFTAANGTVYSDEVLADPYNQYVTLGGGFVTPPPLARVITDTHFAARDRMGRLVGFVARLIADGDLADPIGIGVDERTALVIDDAGTGTVRGTGSVYLVKPGSAPAVCSSGQPLEWSEVPIHELVAGDVVHFPAATTAVEGRTVSAAGGELTPADPY